jgi:sulfur carrier protein ThiS
MEKNQELYQEEQRQLLLDLNKGMSLLSVKLQEQIDAYEVPVKSLEVSGKVQVNTEKTIEVSNLTELQEAINSLETTLSTVIVENSYKPVDKVSVSNIKEAMPKDLAITNLAELKKYFDTIGEAIKANQPIIEVQKQNVIFPTSAGQPVSVRLSDGKSFYKAVAAIASAGLSKLAETNLESLLFDGSGNLKVTSTGGGSGDGAILDGVNPATKATVKDIGVQVTTADHGLVTNTVMHGVTTGGGGGYVDVKVNPSGALTVDSTISGTVVAFAKSTEQYAINDIEATATYKYFGFQKSDGGWYIMRKTIATKKFEYVAGASAYATAWTNRASQTYTDYATAF